MTNEHISSETEGRHAAAPPDSTVEVRSTASPYHDRERLASYRRTAPRPPAARAGALIVLLVGLTVVDAQWGFYPQSPQGQSNANWALGFMILSTAGALRILMGSRYDAPAAERAAPEAVDPAEQSGLDLWKAMDEGRDPTAGPAE